MNTIDFCKRIQKMLRQVPTVKQSVRTRLQKAFKEAESAEFLDQLYKNNLIESSGSVPIESSAGMTQVVVEEEGIFNDGTGPVVYTYEAVLRPVPFPECLVEHC